MIHEITRLKIHQRNLEILREQQAMYDAGLVPLHIINSIDINVEQVAEIENTLRRRLHALQLKAATYGLSADPSITIEIEDIESYFEEVQNEQVTRDDRDIRPGPNTEIL